MPTPGDFRAQFELQVRATGVGELDVLAQAEQRAKAAAEALRQEFIQGVISAEQYKRAVTPLRSEVAFLGKEWEQSLVPLESLRGGAEALASSLEASATRQGAAAQKTALEVVAASAKINAALGKEAAEAEQAAARVEAAERAEAEEMVRLAAQHAAMLEKLEADEERAAQARGAAAQKAALDVAAASEKINAAMAKEAAEAEQAARREVEARRRETAEVEAEVIRGETVEQARAAHAQEIADQVARVRRRELDAGGYIQRQIAGISLEQEHLNSVIMAGAQVEQEAVAVRTGSARSFQQLAVAMLGAEERMKRMGDTVGYVAPGYTNASTAAGKFSYALLNVSHAAQDAQYGLGAVLNNIPLVTQTVIQAVPILDKWAAHVGGPMGVAGAFMIAATAANSLYNNWDKIQDFAGVGIKTPILDSTKQLAADVKHASKEFETLSQKTVLSVEELDRFKKAADTIHADEERKERERAIKEIEGIQGEKERETAADVRKAIEQAGGGAQAERTLIQALVNVGDQTGQKYTIQGVTRQAEDMLRDAMKGSAGARDEVARTIRGFMPEGSQGLAEALESTSAERRRVDSEDEIADRALQESIKNLKGDRERRDQARKQEVSTHAAKFAQKDSLGGLMQGEAQKLVAGGVEDPEEIKARLRAQAEARLRDSKIVPEGMLAEVAGKVLDKAIEELFSGLAVGEGGLRAVAQQALDKIKEGADAKKAREQKAVEALPGKALAAGQKAEKLGRAVEQSQIAVGLNRDFGLTPQQAKAAAPQVQKLVDMGHDPEGAARAVIAQLQQTLLKQEIMIERSNAMWEQMMGAIGPHTQRLMMLEQQQAMLQQQAMMMRGQVGAQRVQRAFPGNTIPF